MRVGHSMNDDLTNPDRVREGGPRALPRPCASCTVVSAYNNSTQITPAFTLTPWTRKSPESQRLTPFPRRDM